MLVSKKKINAEPVHRSRIRRFVSIEVISASRSSPCASNASSFPDFNKSVFDILASLCRCITAPVRSRLLKSFLRDKLRQYASRRSNAIRCVYATARWRDGSAFGSRTAIARASNVRKFGVFAESRLFAVTSRRRFAASLHCPYYRSCYLCPLRHRMHRTTELLYLTSRSVHFIFPFSSFALYISPNERGIFFQMIFAIILRSALRKKRVYFSLTSLHTRFFLLSFFNIHPYISRNLFAHSGSAPSSIYLPCLFIHRTIGRVS